MSTRARVVNTQLKSKITTEVSHEVLARFDAIAKVRGISRCKLACRVIEDFLASDRTGRDARDLSHG